MCIYIYTYIYNTYTPVGTDRSVECLRRGNVAPALFTCWPNIYVVLLALLSLLFSLVSLSSSLLLSLLLFVSSLQLSWSLFVHLWAQNAWIDHYVNWAMHDGGRQETGVKRTPHHPLSWMSPKTNLVLSLWPLLPPDCFWWVLITPGSPPMWCMPTVPFASPHRQSPWDMYKYMCICIYIYIYIYIHRERETERYDIISWIL